MKGSLGEKMLAPHHSNEITENWGLEENQNNEKINKQKK